MSDNTSLIKDLKELIAATSDALYSRSWSPRDWYKFTRDPMNTSIRSGNSVL